MEQQACASGCGIETGQSGTQARSVRRLQVITVAWMLIECGAALYGAWQARSAVLLAFGSDSLVELLSGAVVLAAFSPHLRLPKERADRAAGVLLFVLAGVVAVIAIAAFLGASEPRSSPAGIAVTIAALMAMPLLAWRKRKLSHATGSKALAADAVQSATCAWLAAASLVGLVFDAALHVRWIDSAAALVVLPLLIVEGRRSIRGEGCACSCSATLSH